MQMTSPSKPKRNVKVSGISFDPQIWERLEAESERMERPNRSLVVERALRQYFRIQDSRRDGEPIVVLSEGAA